MANIIIRKMQPEDWQEVAVIYEQGIASGKSTYPQDVPSYEEWDRAHHQHSRLVAEIDGKIAGWIALTPSFARAIYSGVAEISLYVHQDYQRQGVGRRLVQAMEEESVRNGIWTLEALIFEDNLPSLNLFQSCGFNLLGIRQKLGYDKKLNKWRNVAFLEKRSNNI